MDAKVEVKQVPGKPGWYEAVAWLRPYFQCEDQSASIRVGFEVPRR
jgi:type VI secretion system protein ImpC